MPKIIPMFGRRKPPKTKIRVTHQGSLLGYKLNQKQAERRLHLMHAIKKYGYGETMKKLNALFVFNTKNPTKASKIERDKMFLERTVGKGY